MTWEVTSRTAQPRNPLGWLVSNAWTSPDLPMYSTVNFGVQFHCIPTHQLLGIAATIPFQTQQENLAKTQPGSSKWSHTTRKTSVVCRSLGHLSRFVAPKQRASPKKEPVLTKKQTFKSTLKAIEAAQSHSWPPKWDLYAQVAYQQSTLHSFTFIRCWNCCQSELSLCSRSYTVLPGQ